MMKKWCGTLAIILCIGILSACGGQASEAVNTSASSSSAQETGDSGKARRRIRSRRLIRMPKSLRCRYT